MNKKDNYTKTIKLMILGSTFFVILVAIYGAAIKTNNEILMIITASITGVIILFNILLVSKNKKHTNNARKMILKKEITTINLNPLGVFLIDKIWYHKKGKITYRQIRAMLLHSISENRIIYNDSKLTINNNFKFDELANLEKLAIEMSFLDAIEFKQNEKLKEEKLIKIQNDSLPLRLEDIKININSNCKNKSAFYDIYSNVKAEYFVDIEGNGEAVLTIISWFLVILEFILGINFINNGEILSFYLPISLALILTFLVTSKYRERVVLKIDKKEEITDILNYIRYIENNSCLGIDKIYLYALNKLSDKEDILKIFFIE